MDWVRIHSGSYWVMFVVTFLAVAQWESMRPERKWMVPAGKRWMRHGGMLLLSIVFRALVLRGTPVALAVAVQERNWGAFRLPLFESAPGYAAAIAAAILLMDLSKYASHRLLHSFTWLWRVHRVHHTDPDFDVSTGVRFHPIEALLTSGMNLAVVWLFAPPVAGVVFAELLGGAVNFIEHANATLPERWERRLRPWLVTPSIHRIHHSAETGDYDHNFGELFPWWDKLLGTYAGQSSAGKNHGLGLRGYQTSHSLDWDEMLLQPFRPSREQAGDAPGAVAVANDAG